MYKQDDKSYHLERLGIKNSHYLISGLIGERLDKTKVHLEILKRFQLLNIFCELLYPCISNEVEKPITMYWCIMGYRLGQLKTVLICCVKKKEFRFNIFENPLINNVKVQNLKYFLVLLELSRKYLTKNNYVL